MKIVTEPMAELCVGDGIGVRAKRRITAVCSVRSLGYGRPQAKGCVLLCSSSLPLIV